MVARITTPASLKETLNYNEQKVRKGTAMCIAENNFLLPVNTMNFYDKLHWFENRNELNTRASTKTLHISLNFSPLESFTKGQLTNIANEYMQSIGFGDQPYLVYQHNDAGHPHIHIVATTIRSDGTRINTHNLGKNQSEIARRQIEEKHNLIKADNNHRTLEQTLNGFNLSKLEYGKAETRRGIANVLKQVLGLYNYTSLPELNAVLQQFGIIADRGKEGSFTHCKNGLLYRVLDINTNPIGVPIKASCLPGSPTLAYLEKKFSLNKHKRSTLKNFLQIAIENALKKKPLDLNQFISYLSDQQIHTVLRQNVDGKVYGITYVDHKNKAVFNGSEIGKAYSIAGVIKQFNQRRYYRQPIPSKAVLLIKQLKIDKTLIEDLLLPQQDFQTIPYYFKKKRKKKRKS